MRNCYGNFNSNFEANNQLEKNGLYMIIALIYIHKSINDRSGNFFNIVKCSFYL